MERKEASWYSISEKMRSCRVVSPRKTSVEMM